MLGDLLGPAWELSGLEGKGKEWNFSFGPSSASSSSESLVTPKPPKGHPRIFSHRFLGEYPVPCLKCINHDEASPALPPTLLHLIAIFSPRRLSFPNEF